MLSRPDCIITVHRSLTSVPGGPLPTKCSALPFTGIFSIIAAKEHAPARRVSFLQVLAKVPATERNVPRASWHACLRTPTLTGSPFSGCRGWWPSPTSPWCLERRRRSFHRWRRCTLRCPGWRRRCLIWPPCSPVKTKERSRPIEPHFYVRFRCTVRRCACARESNSLRQAHASLTLHKTDCRRTSTGPAKSL